MIDSDFNTFSQAWADAHDVMAAGKVLTPRAMESIFYDLEDYSFDVVLASIKIHRKAAKFAPTVFDIVEIIKDRTGAKHIGIEEAWSIAEASFDENLTVVWTNEIAEARGHVSGLYENDKVAARMAFKDAYGRIIKTANEPRWFVTEGHDHSLRADAVKAAVLLKRLPPLKADSRYLIEAPTTSMQGLIEKAHKVTGKVDALAKIALIKTVLQIDEEADLVDARAKERAKFELKRTTQLDAVADKLRGAMH